MPRVMTHLCFVVLEFLLLISSWPCYAKRIVQQQNVGSGLWPLSRPMSNHSLVEVSSRTLVWKEDAQCKRTQQALNKPALVKIAVSTGGLMIMKHLSNEVYLGIGDVKELSVQLPIRLWKSRSSRIAHLEVGVPGVAETMVRVKMSDVEAHFSGLPVSPSFKKLSLEAVPKDKKKAMMGLELDIQVDVRHRQYKPRIRPDSLHSNIKFTKLKMTSAGVSGFFSKIGLSVAKWGGVLDAASVQGVLINWLGNVFLDVLVAALPQDFWRVMLSELEAFHSEINVAASIKEGDVKVDAVVEDLEYEISREGLTILMKDGIEKSLEWLGLGRGKPLLQQASYFGQRLIEVGFKSSAFTDAHITIGPFPKRGDASEAVIGGGPQLTIKAMVEPAEMFVGEGPNKATIKQTSVTDCLDSQSPALCQKLAEMVSAIEGLFGVDKVKVEESVQILGPWMNTVLQTNFPELFAMNVMEAHTRWRERCEYAEVADGSGRQWRLPVLLSHVLALKDPNNLRQLEKWYHLMDILNSFDFDAKFQQAVVQPADANSPPTMLITTKPSKSTQSKPITINFLQKGPTASLREYLKLIPPGLIIGT